MRPIENPNITFQPSIIPELLINRVGRNNESFRFEWKGNSFEIEIFFHATNEKNITKLWSLRDFEVDFNVSVQYVVNQSQTYCQFGWLIENVEDASVFVHNAFLKIEDTQPFDYEEIELDVVPLDDEVNITIYHLPNNLDLSFEDLHSKGFIIGHQNKTCTTVKGFSGKSSWNLDPIIYSDDTIYVGQDTTDLFDDIYTAEVAGGWNIFKKQGHESFMSGAEIVINETYACSDVKAQIEFNSTAIANNGDIGIEVKANAQLRFGTLINKTSRLVEDGCSFNYPIKGSGASRYLIKATESGSSVELYGCEFSYGGISYDLWICANNLTAYHCLFDGAIVYLSNVDMYGCTFLHAPRDFQFYNVGTIADGVMDHVRFLGDNGGATTTALYYAYTVSRTLSNIYARGFGRIISVTGKEVERNYTLINCDTDSWDLTISGAGMKVWRKYEHDFTFTFQNGSYFQGVNVTITYEGQGGGTIGSWLTNSTGQIPTQTLTRSFYNATGDKSEYPHYPFNITASYEGYDTYTKKWTPTEKTTWEIALTEETVSTEEQETSAGGVWQIDVPDPLWHIRNAIQHILVILTPHAIEIVAVLIAVGALMVIRREDKKKKQKIRRY